MRYSKHNPVSIVLNKYGVLVEYLTAIIVMRDGTKYRVDTNTEYDMIEYLEVNKDNIVALTVESVDADDDMVLDHTELIAVNGISFLPYRHIAQQYCIDHIYHLLYSDELKDICVTNPIYPDDDLNLLSRANIDIARKLSTGLTKEVDGIARKSSTEDMELLDSRLAKITEDHPLSITRVGMLRFSILIEVHHDTRIIRYERMLNGLSSTEVDNRMGENLFCN